MTTEERIARLAARAAMLVQEGKSVGLGSGSTAEAVVRALGSRVASGLRLTAVATSSNTAKLAEANAIPLVHIDDIDRLDLGIDGADEIDPSLDVVKGRGGALLWEKLCARLCDEFVIVSTTEKLVDRLGTRMPLPVEIIPHGWKETARRIEATGCRPVLRLSAGEETPYITDGGHYIVDCETGPIYEPDSFAFQLKAITGVVDHGLFINYATRALLVDEAGDVIERARPG